MKKMVLIFVLTIIFLPVISYAKIGFKVTNEMIYEKLLEIEKRQAIFEERFKQIDKRFEMIDKRFEDMNKRFEELRDDMNKRFEQVDKRFEEMIKFLEIISLSFAGLVAVLVGILIWDRRSAMRRAEEEMNKKYKLEMLLRLLEAMKELAKEDVKVAKVLRNFGLL